MNRVSLGDAVYAVKFSPHSNQTTLAVASCENFGIQGKGHIDLITFPIEASTTASTTSFNLGRWSWSDTLYDVDWNCEDPRFLVAAAGDGCVLLVDTADASCKLGPRQVHSAEVHSVEWVQGRNLLTASWDGQAKLTDLEGKTLSQLSGHNGLVYQAKSRGPLQPTDVLTACADHKLRVWDLRLSTSLPVNAMTHVSEVLSCDWIAANANQIVAGDTSCAICVWDIRQPLKPLLTLNHHKQAVRRVVSSPERPEVLYSCGYDFSVREFLLSSGVQIAEYSNHHSEFVYGLDIKAISSVVNIADGSWDKSICLYPASKYT